MTLQVLTAKKPPKKPKEALIEKPLLLMEDSAASKYGSVLMQHQSPSNFKSFFLRNGVLAPGVEPQTQEPWLRPLLPGRLSLELQLGVGYQQHRRGGSGGSRGPTCHFAQPAFREFPPVPLTPSRQPLTPWHSWESLLVSQTRSIWRYLMRFFGRLEMHK